MKYFIPLESGNYYHVFNRAVGAEKLFKSEANFIYFLRKYKEYIYPIADTFSYVLMPNHFHFLINIKSKNDIYERYKTLEMNKDNPKPIANIDLDYEKFVMQQFSNFFNSYTKSFNKMYNRKGALFIDYVKRTLVDTEVYLKNIVLYIHQNPIHHKYCKQVGDWKFSSYNSFCTDKDSYLQRNEVIDWFGDLENFIFEHSIVNNVDFEY
jgi:REP element-mobilizing transposase RayT